MTIKWQQHGDVHVATHNNVRFTIAPLVGYEGWFIVVAGTADEPRCLVFKKRLADAKEACEGFPGFATAALPMVVGILVRGDLEDDEPPGRPN